MSATRLRKRAFILTPFPGRGRCTGTLALGLGFLACVPARGVLAGERFARKETRIAEQGRERAEVLGEGPGQPARHGDHTTVRSGDPAAGAGNPAADRAHGRSPAPSGDAAFVAPPFPRTPSFVPDPGRAGKGFSVSRAVISYWTLKGNEVGPWQADLYLPRSRRMSSGKAQGLPAIASGGAGSAPGVPTSAPVGPGAARQQVPGTSAAKVDQEESSSGLHAARERSRSAAQRAAEGSAEQRASERLPLIVVLPVGGLRKDLGAFFARTFVKDGFAVLALGPLPQEASGGVLHSLKGTARTLTEDTANLLRILDFAAALDEVDPGRIGVLGVSRGALATALAAQLRPPGLATVLVLGGADLTGLFRSSRLGIVERMRAEEIARAEGDLEKAVAKAATILRNVDPATRPGRLDPAATLLISARWDHVIPRPQALALRRAAGGAPQRWLPTGHYGTIFFARRVGRLALGHFRRTLLDEGRRLP